MATYALALSGSERLTSIKISSRGREAGKTRAEIRDSMLSFQLNAESGCIVTIAANHLVTAFCNRPACWDQANFELNNIAWNH